MQASGPRLSIVVPAYNVETYLAECLDSILAQPLDDLEVIVVDDGSTDSTLEVARSYLSRDARVRVERQDNAGPGAARNTGIGHASGEFLAFVDADDRLTEDAYTVVLRTLEETGSDFAVGMLKRDSGRVSPRMRDNHVRRRLGISIADQPMMLTDVFPVNKVFRRSFWDTLGLRFPERVRYEDQVLLTQAFLGARAFDVLRHQMYIWRIRVDKTSITQRRHEIEDLRDRVVTKRACTVMVHAHGSPEIERLWHLRILPIDMGGYFREVPGCTDEYWQLLRAAMAEFWSDAGYSFTDADIPVQQRLMGWLVQHDRRPDLERVVSFLVEHRGSPPLELDGPTVRAVLPGADAPDSGIPPELFELHPAELRWEARLLAARWSPQTVALDGFALLRSVPIADHPSTLRAAAVGDGHRVDAQVVARTEPRASAWVGPQSEVDDSGFTATVDLAELAELTERSSPGGQLSWQLELTREVGEVVGAGPFTTWVPRAADGSWHPVGRSHEARLAPHDNLLHLDIRAAGDGPSGGADEPGSRGGRRRIRNGGGRR